LEHVRNLKEVVLIILQDAFPIILLQTVPFKLVLLMVEDTAVLCNLQHELLQSLIIGGLATRKAAYILQTFLELKWKATAQHIRAYFFLHRPHQYGLFLDVQGLDALSRQRALQEVDQIIEQ